MVGISVLLRDTKDNWTPNDVRPEKMIILSVEHLISEN